jgi:monoamine oxidase
MRLSRRSFLASASAALAAPAAIGAPAARRADVDAVIVGAGAAGIAAARRLAAAGRRFVLLEAADHVGGRCVTDRSTFGVPFDRGAHWIHSPSVNPVVRLTPHGIDIYPAPTSQKVRIGLRNAREGELEDFLASEVRATRAIREAARKSDIACAAALPNDLGEWGATLQFMLGPFTCGKDLAQLSAADFARASEHKADAFCRQGFGVLLATLAAGIPVKLSTPATAIDLSRTVAVTTPQGTISARTAIVTVSTNVIAAGRIRFTPELPDRLTNAFHALSLGSYDHIALGLAGNPLGLDSDDLVFEKSADTHTAALLGNVSGTSLCVVDVAAAFGRDLSAHGAAAMVDFAGDWLAKLYGSAVKKAVNRASATRWNADPLALGAMSAAAPGEGAARGIVAEPLHDVVWFAGEAAHETLWGTVGGAWASGDRAAAAALRRLGGETEPVAAERERRPAPRSRRARRHTRRESPQADVVRQPREP